MNIIMYGATWCVDCKRVKSLLGQHKVSYKYIDIEQNKNAAQKVIELNKGLSVVPTFEIDGDILTNPSNSVLLQKLKLKEENKTHYCDLIVVGGGPSGLTAAIYTTREGVETEIFEKKALGGQAAVTDRIENYPGFPEGVSGLDLSQKMAKQAEEFGAKIRTGIEVTKIIDSGKYKTVETTEGPFHAQTVLLSLGTEYKKLKVPGEDELIGRGIHFCATCDGPFYRNKEVIVVGGGNSAMQEGLFLTRFVNKVTLIVWGDKLTGSDFMVEKVTTDPKFDIHYNLATTKLEKVDNKMVFHATNRVTNREEIYKTDGIFVFIGLRPNTEFLKASGVELDDRGFIKTDKLLMTTIKGVFASGDCRSGSTLQIASAVGEGAVAALMIREYLKENS
ncbi:MAG: FAD-dependent oxidoreductase [Patescibacteria group bacterium]